MGYIVFLTTHLKQKFFYQGKIEGMAEGKAEGMAARDAEWIEWAANGKNPDTMPSKINPVTTTTQDNDNADGYSPNGYPTLCFWNRSSRASANRSWMLVSAFTDSCLSWRWIAGSKCPAISFLPAREDPDILGAGFFGVVRSSGDVSVLPAVFNASVRLGFFAIFFFSY